MTAAEAAKACMERVAKCLDEFYAVTSPEMTLIEQDFTEIISRVTPPLTLEQEMAWMAHKKQQNLAMWRGGDFTPTAATLLHEDKRRKDIALAQLDQTCDRFPQEIVEPQPKPWWKRWLA